MTVDKKLDEITQYAKKFDNHYVGTQWDNWKTDLQVELDSWCDTEDELNKIMAVILKLNLGEVTKNLFEGAAEQLINEKYDNEEWVTKEYSLPKD